MIPSDTREAEAAETRIQSQSCLLSKSKATVCYLRLCLKKEKRRRRQTRQKKTSLSKQIRTPNIPEALNNNASYSFS